MSGKSLISLGVKPLLFQRLSQMQALVMEEATAPLGISLKRHLSIISIRNPPQVLGLLQGSTLSKLWWFLPPSWFLGDLGSVSSCLCAPFSPTGTLTSSSSREQAVGGALLCQVQLPETRDTEI